VVILVSVGSTPFLYILERTSRTIVTIVGVGSGGRAARTDFVSVFE
jgi:hypothetical protein